MSGSADIGWKRAGRWVAATWVVWAALAPTAVFGQSPDYDVESDGWNGLSRFVQLSEDLGTPVEPREELDYGALRPSDTLVIVYPKQDLDVRALADFVIDGGRILLADDFGRAAPLLERLDIDRRRIDEGELPHNEFVRDNRSLPIFTPEGVHPLLEGVGVVAGNHPTILHHSGGSVVPYDESLTPDEDPPGVVYDMNLGDGKVVVYGDASLLINHMLRVADNRRLVENSLRYVCEGRSECRPQLLVGAFEQIGTYRRGSEAERSVAWVAERFNEVVQEVQQEVPSRPLLFYLALILTAGLVLYLSTVFSLRDSRRYSEYIEEAIQEVPAPQTEFEWNVSRFGADRRETNFALPLAILKEIFEEILLQELGYWDDPPEERPSNRELAREIREEFFTDRPPQERDRLEDRVRDLLASYDDIPTRHRVFLDSDAYFSDRDLIQLYRRTRSMLERMGLQEEYERRTRTLV